MRLIFFGGTNQENFVLFIKIEAFPAAHMFYFFIFLNIINKRLILLAKLLKEYCCKNNQRKGTGKRSESPFRCFDTAQRHVRGSAYIFYDCPKV
jgi:hypothetical protein